MEDQYRIDGHKLNFHPHRVVNFLDNKNTWETAKKIYPIYVEVSPVGACNHRCTFCAVDYIGYKPVRLNENIICERITEMATLGVKSIMFAGEGEPLLHKKINEIVSHTKNAGIDVAFTTNATLMNERFVNQSLQHCSWIKTSINAGSPSSYANIHQCKESDFDLVVRNLTRAVKEKRNRDLDVVLGAQAVLLPENAAEMRDLTLLCRDVIGLDYLVIKPYSQHLSSNTKIYQHINYSDFDTVAEQVAGMSTDKFSVIYREKTAQKHDNAGSDRYCKCNATPFFWAYIMANGSVYGCSAYLLDDRFNYGNLSMQSFKEIWEGERREQNYQFVTKELDIKECRINCRMDEVNRYLDDLVEAKTTHVNFI